MASFGGLEIGLGFLFGGVFLGLAAEVYYLLWWKKRQDFETEQFSSSSPTPVDLKTPNSSKLVNNCGIEEEEEEDLEMGLKQDLVLKDLGEESLDLELMRLHNLSGPPRFLFTINEETKEELESERSRKGSRTHFETPFLSPQASSPLKVSLEEYHHHGVNPLFESNGFDFDFDKVKLVSSSPPPTFKFLRDAEEKLLRRLMKAQKEEEEEEEEGGEGDGSFVKTSVGKGKKGIHHHHHHHHHRHLLQVSTASQVLPLASSPSTIVGSVEKK